MVDSSSRIAAQRRLVDLADQRGQALHGNPGSCFPVSVVAQRRLLPIARHREIVVDAAKTLNDPATATTAEWRQAIYKVLEGEGHPAAQNVPEKLAEQRILDADDWDLIEHDIQEYKAHRGKGFDLFERHNMPRAHDEQTANKWVASLIENRVNDLYTSVPGFNGHAMQIQLCIRSLVGWYEDGSFPESAFLRFKQSIVSALRVARAKAGRNAGFPEFVYTFENQTTETV